MSFSNLPSVSSPISRQSPFSAHKKQKMSLTQTYHLAHTARAKLTKEAARSDHDLRLLVGHANLLDGLMIDLADAERDQEQWFNQTVARAEPKRAAPAVPSSPRHIQWSDALPEAELYDEDTDSDSDSDSEVDSDDDMDDSFYAAASPLRRVKSPPAITIDTQEVDSDSENDDDNSDDAELQLTRSPSRSSPPELSHEMESDSEDDSMPPSPPVATDLVLDALVVGKPPRKGAFYEEGFYLPQREVSAY